MNGNPPALPTGGRTPNREKPRLAQVPAGHLAETIRRKCAPSTSRQYGEGQNDLFFLPEAGAELEQITGFGRKRAFNAYELTYLGLGHRFQDESGRIQIVVTRILPIYSASRGPTHAKVVSEGNDAMLDILERERQIQNDLEKTCNTDEDGYCIDPFLDYGASEVVLFGHTHPDLGCFFSPTDHRSNYSTTATPMVTFVCDPIRKDMKAMVGTKCEGMRITVFRPRQDSPHEQTTESRPCTVEELWRKLTGIGAVLLRQNGVRGSFDCYRDWRGDTRMTFNVVYRPKKGRR